MAGSTLSRMGAAVILAAAIASVLLTGCGAGVVGNPAPTEGTVECPYAIPDGLDGQVACYQLERDGMAVPYAVVTAIGKDGGPPLVLQNGGPGGSPWDELAPVIDSEIGRALRAGRSVVVVETRGSRYTSQPMLCEGYYQAQLAAFAGSGADDDGERRAIEECFATWRAEGVDLTQFAAPVLAGDIDAAMRERGVDTYAYYGVSHGTVIGQHLMRLAGERLSGVVLDSVAPLGTDYLDTMPASAESALAVVAQACAAQSECASRYGSIGDALETAMTRLDASPLVIDLPDGSPIDKVRVTGAVLAQLVRQVLFDGPSTANLPFILANLEREDVVSSLRESIGALLSLERWSGDNVIGLSYPAMCADARGIAPDYQPPVTAFGEGAGLGVGLDEMCGALELPGLPDAERTVPAGVKVPVLVLAGGHDPVTPGAWGRELGAALPTARVVEIERAGHGVISDECGLASITAFLGDPADSSIGACAADAAMVFVVED